jgi:hypothetical protein
MIFYRGVANFPIPIQPRFTENGAIEIRNASSETVPVVMVFENRAGKFGFRMARGVKDAAVVDPPELNADLDTIRHKLAVELQEFGLYEKEAKAMVETWRDSWFEEGMRVFYLMPRERVDAVLPLTVKPAPAATARVFVGRVEMLSPATQRNLESAFDAKDKPALTRYGRFLRPFAWQMGRMNDPSLREAENDVLRSVSRNVSCVE